jgi:WD40 repeat protein
MPRRKIGLTLVFVWSLLALGISCQAIWILNRFGRALGPTAVAEGHTKKPRIPKGRVQTGALSAIAFSPDGTLLAGGDEWVHLWDIATKKELSKADPNYDAREVCKYLAFSPDSTKLVSVHEAQRLDRPRSYIALWGVTPDKKLLPIKTLLARNSAAGDPPTLVCFAEFSPDSKCVIGATPDGAIFVWEVATGEELAQVDGGVAASFADDGKTVVAVSSIGQITRWQVRARKVVQFPKKSHSARFIYTHGVTFDPKNGRVAVRDLNSLAIMDTATGNTLKIIGFRDELACSAFSPAKGILAVTEYTACRIWFFDSITGNLCSSVARARRPGQIAFSWNGAFLGWVEDEAVIIEDLATLLAAGKKPGSFPDTAPPNLRVAAEVVVKRALYELASTSTTPETLAVRIVAGAERATPKVELVLQLHNAGDQALRIRVDHLPCLFLVGPGAINVPVRPGPLLPGSVQEPEVIVLRPTESYSLKIRSLDSFGSRSFWLLPGEYELHASYFTEVSPSPKGSTDAGNGFGYVTVWASPVKLVVRRGK